MDTQWSIERIEKIRLEKLQERIGLKDREIITIALDVGFSALECSVERAQNRIEQAVLEDAERQDAERERRSLPGRWRRFKEALTTAWVAAED